MHSDPPSIPLLIPDLPAVAALQPFLERIDAARVYSNHGPLVHELEAALPALMANGSGAGAHAVTVASATAGLELLLQSLELPHGASVMVPAFGFAAAPMVVARLGFHPSFIDVDPVEWAATPALASAALRRETGNRPGALIVVSPFGYPIDAAAWADWQRDTGIPVILDAAASLGNQVLHPAVPTVFSMHATKPFGIGEGGMVVVGDAAAAQRLRKLSNFGFDQRIAAEIGANAKLSEWHAAVGLAQLARWPHNVAARRGTRDLLLPMLARQPHVRLHPAAATAVVSAYCPVLLPDAGQAERLLAALAQDRIDGRRWFYPALPAHPAFAHADADAHTPASTSLAARIVCLPFHSRLNHEDISRIAAAVGAIAEPGLARAAA